MKITIQKDGPYIVDGEVPLARQVIGTNAEGESVEWRAGTRIPTPLRYALCRCGRSGRKPFCDGTHRRGGFDGTETADRRPYLEQAEGIEGPRLTLTDAEPLCAFARFCDPQGRIWNRVSGADEESQVVVRREAGDCPGGRLVAWDRATGQALEPALERSIGLVEDPAQEASGPLWVRGGIPVTGADGHAYEVRNRMALCRCGLSSNKPFCDGTHASAHWKDGLEGG
jgi:CDGSH-type Zn-finger protein